MAGSNDRNRDGLTRRDLLRLGGGAAAGLALGGLGAAGLGLAGTAAVGPARKLLIVLARGGWDTTYALDPKPGISGVDAPGGTVQTFSGIDVLTDPARAGVTNFFSGWAGATTLVRGLEILSVSHTSCAARLLTGTFSTRSPDVGAVLAATHGPDRPVPYLVLGRTAFSGPYAALSARAGSVNQLSLLAAVDNPVWFVVDPQINYTPSVEQEDLVRAYVEARALREKAERGQVGSNRRKLRDFIESLERGDALRAGSDLGEPDFLGGFTEQANVAVDALAQGLCHVAQVEFGDFDTHADNGDQNALHDQFFSGLEALASRLATTDGENTGSKLLDEVTVLVVSEMGRTPRLNGDGGKDHWPVTSAMLFGAGVRGGQVLGGTDDAMLGRKVDLATGAPDEDGSAIDFQSFAAGVMETVGVDPADHLDDVDPLRGIQA